MKKMFLMMCAVAAMVTCASCCGKGDDKKGCDKEGDRPACCQMSEEQRAKHAEMKAKWDKFDELSEEEQATLVAERKACIDKHRAKMAELEARRAELDAKWEKFEELSLAEQKALIDEMDALFPRPHHGEKKCGEKCGAKAEKGHKCCQDGEKPACKH